MRTPTVLTNLQRGNVKQESPVSLHHRTIHELAAQGELYDLEDISLVDSIDSDGLTPLCWASYYGQDSAIELLIKYGANLNHRAKGGRTPLMFAADKGYFYVVRILINHGANPNIADDNGNSALMYAAYQDRGWVIRELLTRGAKLALMNNKKQTAYSISISRHNKCAQASIESYLISLFKQLNPDLDLSSITWQ